MLISKIFGAVFGLLGAVAFITAAVARKKDVGYAIEATGLGLLLVGFGAFLIL